MGANRVTPGGDDVGDDLWRGPLRLRPSVDSRALSGALSPHPARACANLGTAVGQVHPS